MLANMLLLAILQFIGGYACTVEIFPKKPTIYFKFEIKITIFMLEDYTLRISNEKGTKDRKVNGSCDWNGISSNYYITDTPGLFTASLSCSNGKTSSIKFEILISELFIKLDRIPENPNDLFSVQISFGDKNGNIEKENDPKHLCNLQLIDSEENLIGKALQATSKEGYANFVGLSVKTPGSYFYHAYIIEEEKYSSVNSSIFSIKAEKLPIVDVILAKFPENVTVNSSFNITVSMIGNDGVDFKQDTLVTLTETSFLGLHGNLSSYSSKGTVIFTDLIFSEIGKGSIKISTNSSDITKTISINITKNIEESKLINITQNFEEPKLIIKVPFIVSAISAFFILMAHFYDKLCDRPRCENRFILNFSLTSIWIQQPNKRRVFISLQLLATILSTLALTGVLMLFSSSTIGLSIFFNIFFITLSFPLGIITRRLLYRYTYIENLRLINEEQDILYKNWMLVTLSMACFLFNILLVWTLSRQNVSYLWLLSFLNSFAGNSLTEAYKAYKEAENYRQLNPDMDDGGGIS